MNAETGTSRSAVIREAIRRLLDERAHLKWLVFIVCLITFGLGALTGQLEEAENYAEIREADWTATNMWLKSAECARQRGVWLAVCEGDELVPISEYSFGDDPGHALFLGIWAMATGETVALDDVARLNIGLNVVGFIALASFLFAIRAHVTSIAFLLIGPDIYLGWNGISPHWGLVGATSWALVLPMALVAKEFGFLSRRSGSAFIAAGILGFAVVVLVRESIGLMFFVTSIGLLGALLVYRWQSKRGLWGLLGVGLLVIAASEASTWVVWARDASFEIAAAQRVATHNFSHTLYIGLGAVTNEFGLWYHDEVAMMGVQRVAPDVLYCSPDYYQVLWGLYWSTIASDPVEAMRIYFEKAKLILADSIVEPGLPLGVILILTLGHFVASTRFGAWRRTNFSQGLLIEGAAVILIGFFVAQAVLAHPARLFAMPMAAALLMLFGVMLESLFRLAVVYLAPNWDKEAVKPV